ANCASMNKQRIAEKTTDTYRILFEVGLRIIPFGIVGGGVIITAQATQPRWGCVIYFSRFQQYSIFTESVSRAVASAPHEQADHRGAARYPLRRFFKENNERFIQTRSDGHRHISRRNYDLRSVRVAPRQRH